MHFDTAWEKKRRKKEEGKKDGRMEEKRLVRTLADGVSRTTLPSCVIVLVIEYQYNDRG